jgi:Putative Ig domain
MFKPLASGRLRIALAALALFLPTGCGGGGGGGGGGGSVAPGAPNIVAYSMNPIVATMNVPIGPITPTVIGAVDSFTVAPPLPAGLVLDPSTGAISGTPIGGRLPSTSFVITATNVNGSDALTVVLRVLEPPVLAGYTMDPAAYEVNQAITPNAPIKSGDVTSYSIAPPLPPGLTFNTSTGVISGTPTNVMSEVTFTVTAVNVDGTDTVHVRIAVVPGFLMHIAADRPLARSDLLPATGFTPPLGGLQSNAPLLATDTASPATATLGGTTPVGAPTPPAAGIAPTGTGTGFLDATVAYTASVSITGTPPAPWTPACSILAPYDTIACSLLGFNVARGDVQPGQLQMQVYDTAGPESLLTNAIATHRYQVAQVSDINPTGNDSLLSLFTLTGNGRLVFRAQNTLSAAKLFVYNDAGLGALTQLSNTRGAQNLTDNISSVSGIVTYNGKLIFAADDGNSGGFRKLFQYDPATDAMTRLSNTFPGNSDSPEEFAVYDGKLFFTARNPNNKRKLYAYSETPTPTIRQVTEMNPPEKDDSPAWSTPYNGRLYFVGNADIDGAIKKLFAYDALTGTVAQACDITGPFTSDNPRSLFVFAGSLYFMADTGASAIANKLFRFDGLTLTQVSNTSGGQNADEIREVTEYNNKLFFTAATNSSGTVRKLFSYEPTGGGTVLRVADAAGAASSDEPEYLTVYNNKLFFRANRTGGASKLFCYDDFTAVLKQLSNTINNQAQPDDPRYLMVYGSKLYFSAWSAFAVTKLFAYEDGGGTIAQVSDTHADPTLSDSPMPMIVYHGKLFFTALDEEARLKLYELCDLVTGCMLP